MTQLKSQVAEHIVYTQVVCVIVLAWRALPWYYNS